VAWRHFEIAVAKALDKGRRTDAEHSTDGSEGADRAMDVAAEIAKKVGGNLSCITVGDKLSREEMRQLSAAERDVWEAVDSFSKQILSRGMERAQQFGVSMANTHIAFGIPRR
jgi:nucleotide-binding universal stress UspA family protein